MPFYRVGLTYEGKDHPSLGSFHTIWIMQALETGGFKPLYCDLYVQQEEVSDEEGQS